MPEIIGYKTAQDFCNRMKECGISLTAIVGCIESLESGTRMSEEEKKAVEIIPCHGSCCDYGWVLDRIDEIESILNE